MTAFELAQCKRPCCQASGECCGCCGEALQRPRWHKSLTFDVLTDAVRRRLRSLDHPGFCLVCGLEHGNCEPDARRYECEACGTATVYGADELLLRLVPPWR